MLGSKRAFLLLKSDRSWGAHITDEETLRDIKRPKPQPNMGQNQDFNLGRYIDFCPEIRGSQWTSSVLDLGHCQVPLLPAGTHSALLSLVVSKDPLQWGGRGVEHTQTTLNLAQLIKNLCLLAS